MSYKIKTKKFILEHEVLLVLLLIAVGTLIRLLFIGSIPSGLNQDEASTGYEAWSLLTSGVDRNGCSWPVLFISWGSGQNVLYSYLLIPIISVFGLNPFTLRLPAALLGSAALPVLWLLVKRLHGHIAGVMALLLLALNPWHIMMSRWALESNILPFFVLLGIYLTVLSEKKPWWLVAAAAVFGLSLYAYGTAFIFLPLYLLLSIFYLLKRRCIKLRHLLISGAVFLLIALPITLCNAINVLGLTEIKLFGVITLPILTETRQAATTAFGGGLSAYLNNFIGALKILWYQSDGLCYNSVPGLMFAPLFLPLSAAGIVFMVLDAVKKRLPRGEWFLLFAALSSFFAMFIITPNINRLNFIFILLICYSAIGAMGVLRLASQLGKLPKRLTAAALILLIAVGFGVFAAQYVGPVNDLISVSFYDDLCGAISYAETLPADTIVIDDTSSLYIFVLFNQRIPPEEFYSSVVYADPDAPFRQVLSFSKYRFGKDFSADNAIYIVRWFEADGLTVLGEYGSYLVCTK